MTNKEAIEIIKYIDSRYPCSLDETFAQVAEQVALNMAIEALETLESAKKELRFAIEHSDGDKKDHYQRALNLLTNKENKE